MTYMIAALIWLLFAGIASEVADRKGRRRWPWFLLGLLVSGLLSIGLVLSLPDPRRLCPHCGTHCPDEASVCRACGRDLGEVPPIEEADPVMVLLTAVVLALALSSLGFVGWTWVGLEYL